MRSRLALIGVAFIAACTHNVAVSNSVPNTNGWRMLDDLSQWRGYDSEAVPPGWSVENNVITKRRGTGDLITKDEFGNFELALDWKISAGGNSGIFYRGTHDYDHIYWSAPEYQLEDNIGAEDNKAPNRWTAAAYALYAPSSGQVPTADRWNTTRIIVRGAHVEHWLNGKKVVEYELWSPEWKAKVAASKFRAYPLYGMATRGRIGIQGDHPGSLSLRNIRIRELP